MKLYIYTFKTLAPLLIGVQAGRASVISTSTRVPGSTIGGAIAKALGLADRSSLFDLTVRGEYVFSDAYPVDGERPAIPAPFPCYQVKLPHLLSKAFEGVEGNVLCIVSSQLAGRGGVVESLKKLFTVVDRVFEERVGVPLALVSKDATGSPIVVNSCGEYDGVLLCFGRRKHVETVWRDSVAISPYTRRAIETMLYGYEAIADEQLFWGLAVLPDTINVDGRCYDVLMGGGKSRGFGRARICFERVELGGGGRGWHLLLSPLPLREGLHVEYMPREKATVLVTGWSTRPRADVVALKPGVIVWVDEEKPYTVLDPPWGFTITSDIPKMYEAISHATRNTVGRVGG